MRLSFLIFSLSCWYHVLQMTLANDISVTRHADGDVFTIPGSCNEACMVLSSGTASPYGSLPSVLTGKANNSCTCQCNYGLPVFREDLRICVDDIQECEVAGFISSSGLVEKVPYVFLPRYGQIIYPQAEIKFEDIDAPVCVITGVQQLGRGGWSELRNLSDVEFPLSLYRDEKRTFLQWTGESKLKETAEGKVVIVKLACRESQPTTTTPYQGVFTPCLAFRVAGSPSKSSIKEVSFSPSSPRPQGLTSAEYAAIGLSSALLALVYVASVSLYLHGRRRKPRSNSDSNDHNVDVDDLEAANVRQEINCDIEPTGLVKCNPLLAVARNHHFESDSNSAISEAELADKLLGSPSTTEAESELDNITSAIIHPHDSTNEPQEQNCNTGSIIGERLPEEDVRVIETTENSNQHNVPVFPGTQRRKLYFNPAYFERQLLLAPPPAAIEFLLKIREVISIAKHKMAAKRFIPSLNEIPEESSLDRQSGSTHTNKRRSNSAQNLPTRIPRKPLRCEGCPGCSHNSSTPNLPGSRGPAGGAAPLSGESRVRAWLEDVKLLEARWRGLDDELMIQHRQSLNGNNLLDHDTETGSRLSSRSLPIVLSEIPQKRLTRNCDNDRNGEFNRSTKRSHEIDETTGKLDGERVRKDATDQEDIIVNANVRRAIENSFKKQLELLQKNAKNVVGVNKSDKLTRTGDNDNSINQTNSKKVLNPKKKQAIVETRALLNAINDELSSVRSSSEAKRIMDAVIKELVVTKEIDTTSSKLASDYETDSLEKTRLSRKSSSSPVSTDKSSPALSTALPVNEELTMRNAIIDVQISETSSSTLNGSIVKNHNLPEVVPLRPETYALVSEVYVNNGYTSPAGSDDDSGPEIQYEPEKPGHLTIRVVDSPRNYIKQDESEYEPDTLDRKPLKLKINIDDTCEREPSVNEVYIDSLERTSQILQLRSKKSFKEEKTDSEDTAKPPRIYSSLREIYEARLKYQQQQQQTQLITQVTENNNQPNCKCNGTSPLLPRHERRQRKADNQPDVVPKPPPPPPPPLPTSTSITLENENLNHLAKNDQDRRSSEAGDPTTCEETPVCDAPEFPVGKTSFNNKLQSWNASSSDFQGVKLKEENGKLKMGIETNGNSRIVEDCQQQARVQSKNFRSNESKIKPSNIQIKNPARLNVIWPINPEDSAYTSSPDSSDSRRRLLGGQDRRVETADCGCSGTESDESTAGGGCYSEHVANSESGAESVETDSVFFGNFRKVDNQQPVANDVQRSNNDARSFQIKSRAC